jgi:PAS domain S-box-containing protein
MATDQYSSMIAHDHTSRLATRSEHLAYSNIRFRILLPLTCLIVALGVLIAMVLVMGAGDRVDDEAQDLADRVPEAFESILTEEAHLMSASLSVLAENGELKEVFLAGDIDRLQARTESLFEELRRDHGITHFYFIDTDRRCVLRVHQPERRGGIIGRATTLEAERTGRTAWGIELGSLQTFTLRTVQPWYDGDQLIGYVEFGEEIEHLTVRLQELLGAHIIIAVRKEYLEREQWELTMAANGRDANWDASATTVVIDTTTDDIPESVRAAFCSDDANECLPITTKVDDQTYRVSWHELIDAGGQTVGEMAAMQNITPEARSLVASVWSTSLICTGVGIASLLFFFLFLGRIQSALRYQSDAIVRSKHQIEQDVVMYRESQEALRERVKELTCLQQVRDGLQPGLSVEQLCRSTTEHLVRGMRYPDITAAVITLDDQRFIAGGSEEGLTHGLHADIVVAGSVCGQLSVSYTENRPFLLPEEQDLIDAVAKILSHWLDRLQAEKSLRESEERYRDLAEMSPGGIFKTDPQGSCLYVNEQWRRISGLTTEDALGDGWGKAIHPDDRERIAKEWADFVQTGGVFESEYRFLSPDGHMSWVFGQAATNRDGQGNVIGYIGWLTNITARKEAEAERGRARTFMQTVIDGVPGALMVINLDHTIALANREASMAASEAGPIASSLKCYQVSHDRETPCDDGCPCPLEQVIATKEPVTLEHVHHDAEGNVVPVEIIVAPIFDDKGEVVQIIEWAHDITDRVQAETERKKLEAQFLQSQKMDAVGQLAGGVAHDFNNLLGGIVGYADLLMMDLPPESVEANYTEEILTAASRAADLTRQLLTFSRRGRSQTVNVDVHSILDEAVALLQRSIDKNIDVAKHFEASPAVVSGDPTELQSAILNLAINARDAMPEGGQLTLSTRTVLLDELYCSEHAEEVSPGLYVEIDVTDTGVGMDIDVQQHLFEPFFTTKEQGKGTGLGLASVYGCIKDHLGAIRVYSEPGLGSTFKMLLPLSSEAAAVTATGTQAPVHGHGHILVIDDEETVRRFVSSALAHLGYSVSCCCDGEEGVAFFREHYADVDLVILDMIMPKLSGEEVFPILKEIDPDVRVLIASGFTQNRSAEAVLDGGALGFLAKPFLVDELSREIARCLSGGT